jgi:hypothetical protein
VKRRRLVGLRRRVPSDRRAAYDAAWAAARDRAERRGAHAWRFVAAGSAELFLEFLEFAAESDPRDDPQLAAALRRLDRELGAADVEEWDELK